MTTTHDDLHACLTRLVAGDRSAAATVVLRFGGLVADLLDSFGVPDADLDGAVHDVAFALVDRIDEWDRSERAPAFVARVSAAVAAELGPDHRVRTA